MTTESGNIKNVKQKIWSFYKMGDTCINVGVSYPFPGGSQWTYTNYIHPQIIEIHSYDQCLL